MSKAFEIIKRGLEEAIKMARAQALEEAAQVVEDMRCDTACLDDHMWCDAYLDASSAIRALSSTADKPDLSSAGDSVRFSGQNAENCAENQTAGTDKRASHSTVFHALTRFDDYVAGRITAEEYAAADGKPTVTQLSPEDAKARSENLKALTTPMVPRAIADKLAEALERYEQLFYSAGFSEETHWSECEFDGEETDPPNDSCNCNVGIIDDTRKALAAYREATKHE